ncbi:MAG TPA: response regulator [Oxalicibacterium sp.]|uniref:response regulator n=1 Tax=Oxalicibacterium sp. TaxID=2766525 RepID=UPI002CE4E4C8|nr:response regulator [Oxalicibacterium sp.]HWU97448.1 response regulator [Oxalicibacterium sp.]
MKLILLVDDEVDTTSVLTLLLEHAGYQVLSASNGLEALDIMSEHSPDLIISDCMMPLMDGPSFLKEVRGNPAYEATPFLLMSSAPDQHDLKNAKFDSFILKPFQFEKLMAIIEPLINVKP